MVPSFETEKVWSGVEFGKDVLAIMRFLVEKRVGSLIYESGT